MLLECRTSNAVSEHVSRDDASEVVLIAVAKPQLLHRVKVVAEHSALESGEGSKEILGRLVGM